MKDFNYSGAKIDKIVMIYIKYVITLFSSECVESGRIEPTCSSTVGLIAKYILRQGGSKPAPRVRVLATEPSELF